jgi:hypothetical protein
MLEDLETAIKYLSDKFQISITGIGRGLGATLLAKTMERLPCLTRVAGISPYLFDDSEVLNLWDNLKPGQTYELADILDGLDFFTFSDFDPGKLGFFNSLGADLLNLHGQKINSRFFYTLAEIDLSFMKEIPGQRGYWICPDAEKVDKIQTLDLKTVDFKKSNLMYLNNFLPRNPRWQHNAIQQLDHWVMEAIG